MLAVAIIDDNAISRNLLTSVLTTGGHHVVGDSNTSQAGIARVIKLRPQVVCIDVARLGSEGMDRIDMIRSELPKALVFLVSGKIDSEAVQEALQHGVHGFIVKPFNALTVLTTIRNTILNFAKQQKAKTVV